MAAALLALVACDPGDETNESGQDVAVDGSEDAPTEDATAEDTEEAQSADGDVEVEGPDGNATNQGGAAPDGDPNQSAPQSYQVGVPIRLHPTIVEATTRWSRSRG